MENVAIAVCAIIGLRSFQKGQLLSFGLNLRVGLNDPCVFGICYPKLGVCAHKQTHTHIWYGIV